MSCHPSQEPTTSDATIETNEQIDLYCSLKQYDLETGERKSDVWTKKVILEGDILLVDGEGAEGVTEFDLFRSDQQLTAYRQSTPYNSTLQISRGTLDAVYRNSGNDYFEGWCSTEAPT